MDGVSGFIRAMGYARLVAVAGVTGLVAAVLIFLMVRAGSPQMALLYSDLDIVDAAQIVEELQGAKTAFRQTRDGTAIFVPESEVFTLRMQFASDGIPARGIVGYEIFDNQNALGTTSFVQNINRARALEGELSRTIASLSTIRSARVHLVLAERVRFSRDSTEPSASISLVPQSGALTHSQVQAIQHLVASAVEALSPARVTVVDQYGNLLASGMGDSSDGVAGASDERLVGYETRLRNRIEDILNRIVGAGNVRVEVTALMDFNRTVTESETFDPESQVVVSTNMRETSLEDTDGSSGVGGSVSIGGDLPEATETTAADGGGAASNETSFEETTNYLNSRTTRTEVQEGGRLIRLNVAVVVDGAQTDDGNGNITYTPRSEDEMARILALVRTAMGFNEERGDMVEVVNLQFTRIAEDIPELEEPGLLDLGRIEIVRIVEVVIFGLIALLTIFFVFRPIMKRLLTPPDPTVFGGGQMAMAPVGTPQLPAPDGAGTTQGAVIAAAPGGAVPQITGTVAAPAPIAMPAQSAASAAIDIAQVQGQVKESSVKKVGEIVAQHPDESVSILRSWLHESG